jgi:triosephosphate isomerase
LEFGFTPIFCVGESLEERKGNTYIEFVQNQLKEVLSEFSEKEISKLVIAYEPVWAIGTGETASDDDAQEVCASIRTWLKENISDNIANSVRIQYGGSVKADNAGSLMQKEDIDGLLVGGASLKAAEFSKIIMYNADK